MEWTQIKSGWLWERKSGISFGKKWEPRWVVVYSDPVAAIGIYEQRSDSQPPYQPIKHLDLNGNTKIYAQKTGRITRWLRKKVVMDGSMGELPEKDMKVFFVDIENSGEKLKFCSINGEEWIETISAFLKEEFNNEKTEEFEEESNEIIEQTHSKNKDPTPKILVKKDLLQLNGQVIIEDRILDRILTDQTLGVVDQRHFGVGRNIEGSDDDSLEMMINSRRSSKQECKWTRILQQYRQSSTIVEKLAILGQFHGFLEQSVTAWKVGELERIDGSLRLQLLVDYWSRGEEEVEAAHSWMSQEMKIVSWIESILEQENPFKLKQPLMAILHVKGMRILGIIEEKEDGQMVDGDERKNILKWLGEKMKITDLENENNVEIWKSGGERIIRSVHSLSTSYLGNDENVMFYYRPEFIQTHENLSMKALIGECTKLIQSSIFGYQKNNYTGFYTSNWPMSSLEWSRFMHSRGLNIALMGAFLENTWTVDIDLLPFHRSSIIIEVASRACKQIFNRNIRLIKDDQIEEFTFGFLNQIASKKFAQEIVEILNIDWGIESISASELFVEMTDNQLLWIQSCIYHCKMMLGNQNILTLEPHKWKFDDLKGIKYALVKKSNLVPVRDHSLLDKEGILIEVAKITTLSSNWKDCEQMALLASLLIQLASIEQEESKKIKLVKLARSITVDSHPQQLVNFSCPICVDTEKLKSLIILQSKNTPLMLHCYNHLAKFANDFEFKELAVDLSHRLYGDSSLLLKELAEMRLKNGDHKIALEIFLKIERQFRIDNDNLESLQNLTIEDGKDKVPKVKDSFTLDLKNSVYSGMASCWKNLGEFERALEYQEKIINPSDAQLYEVANLSLMIFLPSPKLDISLVSKPALGPVRESLKKALSTYSALFHKKRSQAEINNQDSLALLHLAKFIVILKLSLSNCKLLTAVIERKDCEIVEESGVKDMLVSIVGGVEEPAEMVDRILAESEKSLDMLNLNLLFGLCEAIQT